MSLVNGVIFRHVWLCQKWRKETCLWGHGKAASFRVKVERAVLPAMLQACRFLNRKPKGFG